MIILIDRFFLFLHKNLFCQYIYVVYLLEVPRRGASNEYTAYILWRTETKS